MSLFVIYFHTTTYEVVRFVSPSHLNNNGSWTDCSEQLISFYELRVNISAIHNLRIKAAFRIHIHIEHRNIEEKYSKLLIVTSILGPNSRTDDVVIRKGNLQIKNYRNDDETSTTIGTYVMHHKVWLSIETIFQLFHKNFAADASDSLWFVLTPKTLTCYKTVSENEDEKLLMIPLDGLKLRNSEDNSTKNVIALFHPSGQNVHPDYTELELLCKSAGKFNSWKESFTKALNSDEIVRFIDE